MKRLSLELVAPTAAALAEADHTAGGGHARTNFFALLAGGALGGLLFVALDAVINNKGGYLRKTSTTLAHMADRRRKEVRKVMRYAGPRMIRRHPILAVLHIVDGFRSAEPTARKSRGSRVADA